MNKKAYRFRLYPTDEQAHKIHQNIGACRFIYNKMLADKIEYYQQYKKMLWKAPEHYKKDAGLEWLKEMDAVALQVSAMNLNQAFKNFFNRPNVGFPKFKSKKYCKQSYTTSNNNGCMYFPDKFHIKLPKMGFVKLRGGRQIPHCEIIKRATISYEPSGKYYISIFVEYENQVPTQNLDINKSIGLDYSSPKFYIDSNGDEAEYPRFFRKYEQQLAREQRKLSRMKTDSSNYMKQKIKVARIHETIKNSRKDFCHKLSHALTEKYDYIFIEDINLQNLAQTLKLGKSTNDNGFGMFRMMLRYKMGDCGKIVFKINKWAASSKICNCCGFVKKDLNLNERGWECPQCHTINDRDLNAAKNIRDMGIKELFLNTIL